ncbi:MAG: molecular chaperone DnaJ [Rhodospirillaceae bacterium]|nr:molecular chaperone DnaJ [Rhodospirillaceae bacterium]|tara:strand:- start:6158 stop:6754 length:597 start_codon:yes stop_codon:yes gene_type:complete
MARSRSQRALEDDGPSERLCAWEGCNQPGEHRAPLSRHQIGEFQYLCIDHVRVFNQSWNYFEGWDQEEIEAYQHADLTWHRQTWKPDERLIRSRSFREAFLNDDFKDPFGFMNDEAEGGGSKQDRSASREDAGTMAEERRAFQLLKLKPDASKTTIKQRFKDEVKACHPDLNGGDKEAEERLRDVIWAYQRLTRSVPA